MSYTNQSFYTPEDLKLFTETVCETIGLSNLRRFIELKEYNHYLTKEFIKNISNGFSTYIIKEISKSSQKFHEELFDVLYIKKLDELPLMINGDKDIVMVVLWRLKIGK